MKNIIAAVSALCVGIATRARERGPVVVAGFVSFSRDLAVATVGVPGEIRAWWHDSHTLTPYLQGGRLNHEAGRTDVSSSAQDYLLWMRLGVYSDMLFIVLVVVAVVTVIA